MSAFRPGWLPSLLVVLLLPLLIWLGFWQLARAEQKSQLMAHYQLRGEAPPVALTQLLTEPDPAYRRVHIQGRFDAEHSLLLDNRTRNGQAGFELLQPFHDQPSNLWLLVNRGWQAWPDRRITPTFSTPNSEVSLYAWVYQPLGEPFRLQPEKTSAKWPLLLSNAEPQKIWNQLHREGYSHELRLEPGPGALQADWPLVSISPEKHLGYAVQWFALALTLLGLFIYLGIHNARENRHESSLGHA
jgi:surfeit locus 1 family protein